LVSLVTGEGAAPPAGSRTTERALVRTTWGILGALLLENLLGMGLNLYVSLPSSTSFTKVFVTTPLLTAHIALAFLLVAATAAFVLLARRSRIEGLTLRGALAFLSVVVALQEGFAYAFTLNNAYSYGMDVAFVFAVVFEVGILYRLGQARPAAGAPENGPATAPAAR